MILVLTIAASLGIFVAHADQLGTNIGIHLAVFHIYQMNRVNSCSGCV